LLSLCQASDPSLIGAVVSLIGALTCPLGDLVAGGAAAIDVPLRVSRPGQTATVALRAGAEVLDMAEVDLPVG
jgi:hypothetical protein